MLASATHEPHSTVRGGQLERLNEVLRHIWRHNPFYTRKWQAAGLTPREIGSLDAFADFPLTTRVELMVDQGNHLPLGTNLVRPLADIKHIHLSSGTTRAPLYWGDTAESWEWVTCASQLLFELAGVKASDRILTLLRFGASSGPWIIRAGGQRLGCCTFTADPDDPNLQRAVRQLDPSVIVTTSQHLDSRLAQFDGAIKFIITGPRSENEARSANKFSRYGLTEAGSVAGECVAHAGMHLLEKNFIAEVIDPATNTCVADGREGELVLTTLGRLTQPIVRYRTGDLVRLLRDHTCPCGRREALLLGKVQRLLTH